jgi:hypothetical protein
MEQQLFLILTSLLHRTFPDLWKRFSEAVRFSDEQVKQLLELEAAYEWDAFSTRHNGSTSTHKRKRHAFDLDTDITSEVDCFLSLISSSRPPTNFWTVNCGLLPRVHLLSRAYPAAAADLINFTISQNKETNDIELKLLLARSWLSMDK